MAREDSGREDSGPGVRALVGSGPEDSGPGVQALVGSGREDSGPGVQALADSGPGDRGAEGTSVPGRAAQLPMGFTSWKPWTADSSLLRFRVGCS